MKAKTLTTRTLSQRLKDLDGIVARAMKQWGTPGLSVGVVHGEEVVLCRGYGYRDVQKRLPFTERTVSVIGSCTKSMTAACLGILVDQGKLAWDKPVKQYVPWFELADPEIGRRVTPRDLVSHRSGLPGHDRMWYGSDLPRRELVRRMRYLPLSHDLRTTFQYNNLAYAAAAVLIERIADMTWEEFMSEHLLGPLGMETRYFPVDRMQQAPEYAEPYQVREGRAVRVPHYDLPQIGPAGPTAFSALDVCRWLSLNLGVGRFDGRQVVVGDSIKACHRPTIWVPGVIGYPSVCHQTYGMGWMITEFSGHHYLNHGGGISGFSSFMSLLPNEKYGAVVMCNAAGSPALGVINSSIHDRLLGLERIDRVRQAVEDQKKAARAASARAPAAPAARPRGGRRPSHPIHEYAGRYEHPGYGKLTIETMGKSLRATHHRDHGPLEHQHFEVFAWKEATGRNAMLNFHGDAKGRVTAVGASMEPAVGEIVFQRVEG
ncbi:MAG: serine hydrolase [Phycisphaeraceae bacterium]|nr:serine hydrolase [Phycisphaeraceae bacterium]